MATTVTSSTLKVTLTEAITLNGVVRGATNAISITGIGEVDQRLVTVPASPDAATTAYNVLTLGSLAMGGTFASSAVKYIRITNLDDSDSCRLRFGTSNKGAWFNLEAGKSFCIFNDDFLVDDDALPEWTVGTTAFEQYATIFAQTEAANGIDLELFVASA